LTSRLILASRSPQRRAILEQLGIAFEVRPAEIEELGDGPPGEVVLENAYRKAAAVAGVVGAPVGAPAPDAVGSPGPGAVGVPVPDALVLAVDTVVALGARVYGKPRDEEEARATLRTLAGRQHAVVSGLCLMQRGEARTAAVTTLVRFRALDEPLLDWYVRSGEWRGRAGGYAIQGKGAALVASIDGDYLNVVGLPVATLLEMRPELLDV
jgi:septum formation protein